MANTCPACALQLAGNGHQSGGVACLTEQLRRARAHGAKLAGALDDVAGVAHAALNAKDADGADGIAALVDGVVALMQVRTQARVALGLPPIPTADEVAHA